MTTTIVDAVNFVISDLNSRFEEIKLEKNETQFYIKIANYGRVLLDNEDIFSPLFQLLRKQKEKDFEHYKKACDEFYEKWKNLAKDLVEKSKQAGVDNDLIDPLKIKLNKKPPYDSNYPHQYYEPYCKLIEEFKKEGKGELLDNHFEIVGTEKTPILTGYVNNINNEWKKFKNIRRAQVGWAYYQIERLTYGILAPREKDPYYDSNDDVSSLYRQEFEHIARGEKSELQLLRKDRFEEWTTRLHKFLISGLKDLRHREDLAIPTQEVRQKQNRSLSSSASKRELRKKLNGIFEIVKFGKKEKAFLRFLAKDFNPKPIEEISKEVSTKACTSLKCRVQRKLKDTGFFIEIVRPTTWGGKSCYQLKFLI